MISVEKAKSESESSSRRQPSRSDHHSKDSKDENKDKEVILRVCSTRSFCMEIMFSETCLDV